MPTITRLIGFDVPELFKQDYAVLTLWAATEERYHAVKGLVTGLGPAVRPSENTVKDNDGKAVCMVLHWCEGAVSCSMHGPHGYVREPDLPEHFEQAYASVAADERAVASEHRRADAPGGPQA